MPNLLCKCGNTINLSPIPCPSEKLLVGSSDFESILELLESHACEEAERLLESKTQSVIICDNCGRYHISKGGDSTGYQILTPEET